eukprot:scaffold5584_cov97-Skeletonema_dohrnii-CCMP3373.AAC.1
MLEYYLVEKELEKELEQENNGSINRTKKKGLSVSTSNILRNSNSSCIKSTASRSTVRKNKTKLTVPEGPACLERTKKKDHEKAKRQSLSLRRKKCPAASASESFSASAWVGLGHSAPTPAFTISNIRELVTYILSSWFRLSHMQKKRPRLYHHKETLIFYPLSKQYYSDIGKHSDKYK